MANSITNAFKFFKGTIDQFKSWEGFEDLDEKLICFIHDPEAEEGDGWVYTRKTFFKTGKGGVDYTFKGDEYISTNRDGNEITIELKKENILNPEPDEKITDLGNDDPENESLITKNYLRRVIDLNKQIEILNKEDLL